MAIPAVPTAAQAEAGNYRKQHVRLHGLDIAIETPKGKPRRPGWPKMACDYGYIKRTVSSDNDALDVFVGPNRSSELAVVIDQITPDGKFDECKVLLGYTSETDALNAYRKCYTTGWKVGKATSLSIGQFKNWLKHGNQKKPIENQVSRYEARAAWSSISAGVSSLASNEGTMPQSEKQAIQPVRRAGHSSLRPLDEQFPVVLSGHGSATDRRQVHAGADRQQQGLLQGKLPVGVISSSVKKQEEQQVLRISRRIEDSKGLGTIKVDSLRSIEKPGQKLRVDNPEGTGNANRSETFNDEISNMSRGNAIASGVVGKTWNQPNNNSEPNSHRMDDRESTYNASSNEKAEIEKYAAAQTGKFGDRGRFVTTEDGNQIFITSSGTINRTGKPAGGGEANAASKTDWDQRLKSLAKRRGEPLSKVGQPKPQANPNAQTFPTSSKQSPEGRSRAVNDFVGQTMAKIKAAEQSQDEGESAEDPRQHPLHHSQLAAALEQALLNWNNRAEELTAPIQIAGQGASWGGGVRVKPAKNAEYQNRKPQIDSHLDALNQMIADYKASHGVDMTAFIKHNNLIPKNIAAKMDQSDPLINPVDPKDMYAAMFSQAFTEHYAARRLNTQPGQLGMFGNGLGGSMLRAPEVQKKFDWDEKKHPRDADGKFTSGAGEAKKPSITPEERSERRDFWNQFKKQGELLDKTDQPFLPLPGELPKAKQPKSNEEYLLGKRAGDTKIIAGRIFRELESKKHVSLVGQTVRSPEELGEVAQAYRDPRFETFRAIFVKGGKVIGHNAYSSRDPAAVYVPEKVRDTVKEDLESLGADGFYLLHNHPSGNPTPSREDIGFTKHWFKEFGSKLLGHTIIDHNKGTTIARDGSIREYSVENKDFNHKDNADIPSDILDETILNSASLGKVAMKMRAQKNRPVVILTNVRGRVQVVLETSSDTLNNSPHKIIGAIRRMGRKTGSTRAFLVLHLGEKLPDYAKHVREGIFTDIVDENGKALMEEMPVSVRTRKEKMRVIETAREGGKYQALDRDAIHAAIVELYTAKLDRSALKNTIIPTATKATGMIKDGNLESGDRIRGNVRGEQSRKDSRDGSRDPSRAAEWRIGHASLRREDQESNNGKAISSSGIKQGIEKDDIQYSHIGGRIILRSKTYGASGGPYRLQQAQQCGNESTVSNAGNEHAKGSQAFSRGSIGDRSTSKAGKNNDISSTFLRGRRDDNSRDQGRQKLGVIDQPSYDQTSHYAAKNSEEKDSSNRWITVTPPGHEHGHPVMIDKKDGTIKAGMGGKFNGQKIGEMGKAPVISSGDKKASSGDKDRSDSISIVEKDKQDEIKDLSGWIDDKLNRLQAMDEKSRAIRYYFKDLSPDVSEAIAQHVYDSDPAVYDWIRRDNEALRKTSAFTESLSKDRSGNTSDVAKPITWQLSSLSEMSVAQLKNVFGRQGRETYTDNMMPKTKAELIHKILDFQERQTPEAKQKSKESSWSLRDRTIASQNRQIDQRHQELKDHEQRKSSKPAAPAYEPPTIPGQQTSLFGGDDMNSGQKSLFNVARPSKADIRASRQQSAPAPASLLEQIDDEQKTLADSRKPLPGQRDMFSAQSRHEIIVEYYRAAATSKGNPHGKKGDKPVTTTGSFGDKGRFVTIDGRQVFIESKESVAAKRKKRDDAKAPFQPKTVLDHAIVEYIGNHKKMVESFKPFVEDAHKMMNNENGETMHALRDTLSAFGYTGKKASAFLSNLRHKRDYTNIRGFDEMSEYAKKYHPQLLAGRTGESSGSGDFEQQFFERLKQGFTAGYAKHSSEVLELASQMAGSGFFEESQWDYDPGYVEDVPFSAAAVSTTERYSGQFDESKHPRDGNGRFKSIASLIAFHDSRNLSNAERRPEVEAQGFNWKEYKNARYRDENGKPVQQNQAAKPAFSPEPEHEHEEAILNAYNNRSTGDGIDLDSVPREWREDAASWMAPRPKKEEYDDIIAKSQQLADESGMSLEDSIASVLNDRDEESWYREQARRVKERDDAEYVKSAKTRDNIDAATKEITDALRGKAKFTEAAGGSRYANYRGLKLRISDHAQVAGGGFNQTTGERMGESDLQAVVGETHKPRNRQDIRNAVANQLWAQRRGDVQPERFAAIQPGRTRSQQPDCQVYSAIRDHLVETASRLPTCSLAARSYLAAQGRLAQRSAGQGIHDMNQPEQYQPTCTTLGSQFQETATGKQIQVFGSQRNRNNGEMKTADCSQLSTTERYAAMFNAGFSAAIVGKLQTVS